MRPKLAEAPPDATLPGYGVPLRLRVAAIVLRSIFVCAGERHLSEVVIRVWKLD